MATTTEHTADAVVHPEDAELIEQLAKLQQMHEQVHELRLLLPNALQSPQREAIANPSSSNTTEISRALLKAAHKGRSDIQYFKQDWQLEKTRQLFQEANAANTSQGSDTWQTDYRLLAKSGNRTAVTQSRTEDSPFDSADEAKSAFEDFTKPDHKIKLQASDPSKLFPIDAEVNRIRFRIERDEAFEVYRIEPITGGTLPPQVVDQFAQDSSRKNLGKLLVCTFARFNLFNILIGTRHIWKHTTIFVCGNATNVQNS